ncbi:unnamed protein product, partial [Eretmochelys imbricata]
MFFSASVGLADLSCCCSSGSRFSWSCWPRCPPGCRGLVIPRCQLVRILRQYGLEGFGRRSGADWVCLARHKSCYNTKAINCNKNGSSDDGIFQINSKYCGYDGRTLGASNGLLDNNIADDIRCAKLNARKARGLMPWSPPTQGRVEEMLQGKGFEAIRQGML